MGLWKRNAVTLGRAGCIDYELIVANEQAERRRSACDYYPFSRFIIFNSINRHRSLPAVVSTLYKCSPANLNFPHLYSLKITFVDHLYSSSSQQLIGFRNFCSLSSGGGAGGRGYSRFQVTGMIEGFGGFKIFDFGIFFG